MCLCMHNGAFICVVYVHVHIPSICTECAHLHTKARLNVSFFYEEVIQSVLSNDNNVILSLRER